jgi:hypothetical protein
MMCLGMAGWWSAGGISIATLDAYSQFERDDTCNR